ncbi:MAG: hypothetical protein A2W99_11155 [Bacteroidetes bacterium GWF2_33_16]|nr:MAG: hypothetical protein A2X00_04585 [Bacteroidetes bacterium GWE2_32_14]OFY04093.1 MAG: hypothetical protein A2W99_11155 [Bacteroidetes bacterium GWF2_33_16]
MKTITRDNFSKMTLAEKGFLVMNKGKHLTQIRKGDFLQNLYSLEDFFVEIFYSISTDKIHNIEIMTNLSRIDQYINDIKTPESKEEKIQLN